MGVWLPTTWRGHIIFLGAKIILNFATLIAAFAAWDELERTIGISIPGIIYVVVMIVSCFMIMFVAHAYLYGPFLDACSAWAYVRLVLGVTLTYSEAAKIAWKFVPNTTGKWYPMKELKELPKSERKKYILQAQIENEFYG